MGDEEDVDRKKKKALKILLIIISILFILSLLPDDTHPKPIPQIINFSIPENVFINETFLISFKVEDESDPHPIINLTIDGYRINASDGLYKFSPEKYREHKAVLTVINSNGSATKEEKIFTPMIREHFSINGTELSEIQVREFEEWAKEDMGYITPYDPSVRLAVKMLPHLDEETGANQTEKLQWIYYWVKSEFSYQPEPYEIKKLPNDTINKGRGDCEDFAYLYVSAAIAAGLPPENIRVIFGKKNGTNIIDTSENHGPEILHSYVEVKIDTGSGSIWLPLEINPNILSENADSLMESDEFLYRAEKIGFYYYKTRPYPVYRRYYWYTFNNYGIFKED